MATKKINVIVKIVADRMLYVWCDDPAARLKELESIEGVSRGLWETYPTEQLITLVTDPRYDIEEIAQEIRQLLEAEIPQVFRDGLPD